MLHIVILKMVRYATVTMAQIVTGNLVATALTIKLAWISFGEHTVLHPTIRHVWQIPVHSATTLKIWPSAKFLIPLKVASLKMDLPASTCSKGIVLPLMDTIASSPKTPTVRAHIAGRMMATAVQVTGFPSVSPSMDQCAMSQMIFSSLILIASPLTISLA